jgi:hypothetical protein
MRRRMSMAEAVTCGQGLAQHAELPRLLGDLMNAVADNLSAHVLGLVSTDENAQHESRVYEDLVARHRQAAAMLQAIGMEMAGHESMPMGEHDLEAMSSREVADALEAMIRAEEQLIAQVQRYLAEHRAMLDSSDHSGS